MFYTSYCSPHEYWYLDLQLRLLSNYWLLCYIIYKSSFYCTASTVSQSNNFVSTKECQVLLLLGVIPTYLFIVSRPMGLFTYYVIRFWGLWHPVVVMSSLSHLLGHPLVTWWRNIWTALNQNKSLAADSSSICPNVVCLFVCLLLLFIKLKNCLLIAC